MLVYCCKKCNKFYIMGYENEYNEFFCSEKCYKSYCKDKNYIPNWNKLKPIKNALTK